MASENPAVVFAEVAVVFILPFVSDEPEPFAFQHQATYASALVLTSSEVAAQRGLKPLAKIIATASNSQHPSEFTIAPVGAIEKVLKKAGWNAQDVDLWEINEAFAMVTMCPIDDFKLDAEKVNINGGACALGHPVGSTGSRIILTLIHALKRTGGKKGIAALCIGGGEATAVAIEIL